MSTSDTTVEHTPWCVPPQLVREQFSADRPRGYLKFEVPWIVNQFQKRHRCIVALPIIDLDNTRIAARAFLVSLSERREKFRQDLGFEKVALGTAIGSLVASLTESNDLLMELDSLAAEFGFRALSASLAASLAFGNVVRICSCWNSELTRFLGVQYER